MTMRRKAATLATLVGLVSALSALPASANTTASEPCIWQGWPRAIHQCQFLARDPTGDADIWSEYRSLVAKIRSMTRESYRQLRTPPKPDDSAAAIRGEVKRYVESEVERIRQITEKAQLTAPVTTTQSQKPACETEQRQLDHILQTIVKCVDQHSSTNTSSQSSSVHSQTTISITSSTTSH